MGSETIRDVTIKVNIEAGDSSSMNAVADAIKAKFQDAFKNIDASPITSILDVVKQQLDGGIGGVDIGKNIREATEDYRAFSQSIKESQSAMSTVGSHSGIGMPGYGASVSNRASSLVIPQVSKMREESGGAGLDDQHWSKLEARMQKQAESMIREQDRESAAASRADAAEEKRTAAIEARAQREAEAAERAAERESAAEAKKTQQQEAEEKKRADKKIAQEKRVSEAQSAFVGEIASGVGRVAAGAASMAAFAGGEDMQQMLRMLGMIHASHAIYSGASSAGAGMAGMMGMGTGATAAMATLPAIVAAGGALALGHANLSWHEQSTLFTSKQKLAAAYAASAMRHHATRSALRPHDLINRAGAIDAVTVKENAINTHAASVIKTQLQNAESKDFERWGKSSETMEQFETRHNRQSQREDQGLKNNSFKTAINDLNRRKENLSGAESLLTKRGKDLAFSGEEELKKNNWVAKTEADKRWLKLRGQHKEIMKDPDFGYDKDGKPIYSKEQQKRGAEIAVEAQSVEAEAAKNVKDNAEAIVEVKRDQLKLDQDIVKTLAEQNKTAREYKQEAQDVVKREVAKDKAHALSLGISDVGTMWERKRLDEKHQRIEAQKAKNRAEGKDENEGVEQYTQYELQQTQQFGDRSAKTGREQGLRQGLEWGIPRDEAEMTKEAKDEADRRDKETEGLINENEGKIDETAKSIGGDAENNKRGKASELKSAMDEAFNSGKVFDELLKKLEELKAQQEDWLTKVRMFTTGGA